MRALTVTGPGALELQTRRPPAAGPGEVLVAPRVIGLCGTDLDIISGTIDAAFVRYPIVLGHEWAGTVVQGPPALPAGTRVVVEGVVPCGVCTACLAGDTNRCRTYDEFGFVRDGAAADLLVAPQRLVHVLADHVSWESAALVEPAAVVWPAFGRPPPAPGARVLIVGDGTVALLVAVLARQFAPAEVVMLGAREEQRQLAEQAGVDRFTTDRGTAGAGYDLVVEAAGAAPATTAALAAPGRGGTVLLLGYPGRDVVALPVDDVVNGDLSIVGSFSYTSRAWGEVVAMLNSGSLDLGFLVTHRFALPDYADALDCLRAPTGTRGKILIDRALG